MLLGWNLKSVAWVFYLLGLEDQQGSSLLGNRCVTNILMVLSLRANVEFPVEGDLRSQLRPPSLLYLEDKGTQVTNHT